MPRFFVLLILLFGLVFVVAAPSRAAQDETALFEAAAAAWLSPKEAGIASGTYDLHTGNSAYVPIIAPEITPYDEDPAEMREVTASFATSDPQVVTVDALGLMTGVAEGMATVTYTANGETVDYEITVSNDALPERAKAFVYVARREYLKNQRQYLSRVNEYSKWYYRSNKEVGWCAVFTIWCANASGTNPIDEEDAEGTPEDAVVFFREGQVGNQYDGFSKLDRFVGVPSPGYMVIYANLENTYLYTHIGIVTDVVDLNDGLYQVTTVEGNMSGTVKCYTYIYDSNADNHALVTDTRNELRANMSVVPEANQTDPLTQYELSRDTWTVFGFGATWI